MKNKKLVQSFEDIYQTSCYLFLYALENYDPDKGPLAPHIKRTIKYKLRAMLKGERAPRSGEYPFTFLRINTLEPAVD